MLIILEGPDGGGKSTLVERAKGRHGTRMQFVSQLGGRTMTHEQMRRNTYSLLNAMRAGTYDGQAVLCERLHAVSDEVYRGLFGGRHFLSPHELRRLYAELGQRGDVRIVYCRPPVQVAIEEGLKKAGDDDDGWIQRVSEKLAQLYEAYDVVVNRLAWEHGLPVVRYDFTERGPASVLEKLICAG